jgi:hypothetical protein
MPPLDQIEATIAGVTADGATADPSTALLR